MHLTQNQQATALMIGAVAVGTVFYLAHKSVTVKPVEAQQAATMCLQSDGPCYPAATFQLPSGVSYTTPAQAAAAAPVQSVNGLTGVVLVPVPTKLSQLTNDVGFAVPPLVATYTFPATVLLALGTTTQAIPATSATSSMATNCRVAGVPQTGINVDLSQSYVTNGSVMAVLKNNAILSNGATIPVRCEIF